MAGWGIACGVMSSEARAQSGTEWTTAPAPEAATPEQTPPDQTPPEPEPRRDPAGLRGISPFWEELRRGDAAFLARDHERALGHYRQATTLAPQNGEGHLRMAEAQMVLGQLLEARESLSAALRFAGDDGVQRARASFLLADVAERRGAFDEALAAWQAYLLLAEEKPNAPAAPVSTPNASRKTSSARKDGATAEPSPAPRIYTDVARGRIERIEARKQAQADAEEVRKRIAERLQEAEQRLQDSK